MDHPPFDTMRVALKPGLTTLVGPNGSGKSRFIEGLSNDGAALEVAKSSFYEEEGPKGVRELRFRTVEWGNQSRS